VPSIKSQAALLIFRAVAFAAPRNEQRTDLFLKVDIASPSDDWQRDRHERNKSVREEGFHGVL
jgi:hypothetical protein